GLTPTGLTLAATVALTGVLVPGAGRPRWLVAGVSLAVAMLAALPWLVATVVGGALPAAATGVRGFSARAEPGLATLGSLGRLRRIWTSAAVPASRTTPFAVVAAVVLLGVVALGLPVALRNRRAVPLLGLAAVAVAIPAAMATGPGLAFVESAVRL